MLFKALGGEERLINKVKEGLNKKPPEVGAEEVRELHELSLKSEKFRNTIIELANLLSEEQHFLLTQRVLKHQAEEDFVDPPLISTGRLGNNLYQHYYKKWIIVDLENSTENFRKVSIQAYPSDNKRLYELNKILMKQIVHGGRVNADMAQEFLVKAIVFKLSGSPLNRKEHDDAIKAFKSTLDSQKLFLEALEEMSQEEVKVEKVANDINEKSGVKSRWSML